MTVFLAMPGNEELAGKLARLAGGDVGELHVRQFPDGESYVRLASEVKGRDVFLVCTLARPDPQFLALAFAGREIMSQGAKRVVLVAPYLAYMRQDRVLCPGEALTSRLFAQMLEQHFQGLVTVEPHLHRISSLEEIYDIPARVVHARPLIAAWIAKRIPNPLVVGPDAESAPWVKSIASDAGCPWVVFTKKRRGDREVCMMAPPLGGFRGLTPVLVDDIVSSGVTMLKAAEILKSEDFDSPYCIAVHALCTARTARILRDSSAGFLTSNTVPNPDARLDVAPLIAEALGCPVPAG